MASPDQDDFSSIWMMRRLRSVMRNNPGISAELTFDLATLDDDIHDALGETGLVPSQKPRTVFGDFLEAAFSSDVSRVPIQDMAEYQRKLKELGYLDPDYEPTGRWDNQTAGATRRFGHDQQQLFRQGERPGAVSIGTALELAAATLPSQQSKGIIGFFAGIGKSLKGTFQKVVGFRKGQAALTSGHLGGVKATTSLDLAAEGIEGLQQDPVEDALNLLSLVGFGSGLKVGASAVKGTAAALKGAPEAAAFGFRQGASGFARPATEELLARTPSLFNRIPTRLVTKFGGAHRGSQFSDYILKYGPRAQQSRPWMRVAGQYYSASARIAFTPNAAAILRPESPLGAATEQAPEGPWWSDLLVPAFVAPQEGLLRAPRALRQERKAARKAARKEFSATNAGGYAELGSLDGFRIAGYDRPINAVRADINTQAYIHAKAIEKLEASPGWPAIAREGGAVKEEALGAAVAREVAETLIDPKTGARRVSEQAFVEAQEWAAQNPHAIAAYLNDIHTGQKARAALGLEASGLHSEYMQAVQHANELTDLALPLLPAYEEGVAAISAVRDEIRSLRKGFQGDDATIARIQGLNRQLVQMEKNLVRDVPVEALPTIEGMSVERSLQAAKDSLAEVLDTQRATQKRLSDLNSLNKALVRRREEALGLRKEIRQGVLDDIAREQAAVQADLAATRSELGRLSGAKRDMERAVAQAKSTGAHLPSRRVELNDELSQLRRRRDVVAALRNDAQQRRAELTARMKAESDPQVRKTLRAERKAIIEEAKTLNTDVRSLTDELTTRRAEFTRLADQREAVASRLEVARRGADELAERETQVRSRIAELKSQASDIRARRPGGDPVSGVLTMEAGIAARTLAKVEDELKALRAELNGLGPRKEAARAELAQVQRRAQALGAFQDAVPRLPVERRIIPMRADNPRTRQNIDRLLKAWDEADEAGRAALRKELNTVGLGNVADESVAKHLRILRKIAAEEAALPDAHMKAFNELGYKPVFAGHNVLLPSDVLPYADKVLKFSRLDYAWASLGLGTRTQDPRTISRLVNGAARNGVDEVLTDQFPHLFQPGDGRTLVDAVRDEIHRQQRSLAKMSDGAGRTRQTAARMALRFAGVHDVSWPFIQKVVQAKFNLDPELAETVARTVRKTILRSTATGMLPSQAEVAGVVKRLASALQLNGLPGMSEYLRGVALSDIKNIGIGEIRLGKLKPFSSVPDNWGFLPDSLMRMAMYMRFQLNPIWEAQNFVETQTLRLALEDLTPVINPAKKMKTLGITDEANDIYARANGLDPTLTDDAERAFLRSGVYGFNAQAHAVYDHYRIYKREFNKVFHSSDPKVRFDRAAADAHAIEYLRANGRHLIGYGPRTPLEKSVNFIFFPFSFQKKITAAVGGYIATQPMRTFLVHETYKRVELLQKMDEEGSKKFSSLLKQHAPIFAWMTKFNSFAFGISPGEFVGSGPQAIFGSVYKPMAQALGVPVNVLIGALTPGGIRAEDMPEFNKRLKRLVPAYRDVAKFLEALMDEARVALPKPGAARLGRKEQLEAYAEELGEAQEFFANIGASYGAFPSIQGFEASAKVPAADKEAWLAEKDFLETRYPDGARAYVASTGRKAVGNIERREILRKPNKSRAEQGIVAVESLLLELDELEDPDDRSIEGRLFYRDFVEDEVRGLGLRLLSEIGKPFDQLWKRLGYASEFGPLTVEALSDVG